MRCHTRAGRDRWDDGRRGGEHHNSRSLTDNPGEKCPVRTAEGPVAPPSVSARLSGLLSGLSGNHLSRHLPSGCSTALPPSRIRCTCRRIRSRSRSGRLSWICYIDATLSAVRVVRTRCILRPPVAMRPSDHDTWASTSQAAGANRRKAVMVGITGSLSVAPWPIAGARLSRMMRRACHPLVREAVGLYSLSTS